MPKSTIVVEEVRQFASHAGDWWDPNGSEAMLHKLNPVRLKYIRDQIDQHWQCDEHVRTPLEGRTALDVGCGAGQSVGMVNREEPVAAIIQELVDEAAAALESRG